MGCGGRGWGGGGGGVLHLSSAKITYPCAPRVESRIVTLYLFLLVKGFSRYACIQFCFFQNVIYLDHAGNIITAPISIPYLQINHVNVIIWHVISLTYKDDNSILAIMKVYTLTFQLRIILSNSGFVLHRQRSRHLVLRFT